MGCTCRGVRRAVGVASLALLGGGARPWRIGEEVRGRMGDLRFDALRFDAPCWRVHELSAWRSPDWFSL